MPNEVKIELTITKEAVEAFFNGLSALMTRESKEESTREEKKENDTFCVCSVVVDEDNTSIDNHNTTVMHSNVDSHNTTTTTTYTQNTNNTEPTLDDIKQYIWSKNYSLDANRFYNYYKNNGWKTKNGNVMIERWKEYIDNWASNEFSSNKALRAMGAGVTVEERRARHPFEPSDL